MFLSVLCLSENRILLDFRLELNLGIFGILLVVLLVVFLLVVFKFQLNFDKTAHTSIPDDLKSARLGLT